MRDVCLELGMKAHHVETHVTNNEKNINEAALKAFSTWWKKNEKRGRSQKELFTDIKKAYIMSCFLMNFEINPQI